MTEQHDDERQSVSGKAQRAGKLFSMYGPYLIIAAVAVVLIILVVVIAGRGKTSGSVSDTETDTQDTLQVNSQNNMQQETFFADVNVVGLEKNAYTEINQLVEKYFQAILDKDVEELNKFVESDHRLTEEEISKAGEYIEAYENITCYTMDALLDNTYIVYVYYEVKLINIETAAPSLVRMYVCRNSDGSVYIYNGSISDEMEAYAQKMDNNEDVRILVSEVNRKLKEACEQDENLEDFYNKILNETNDTEAEASGEIESEDGENVSEEPVSEEEETNKNDSSEDASDTEENLE